MNVGLPASGGAVLRYGVEAMAGALVSLLDAHDGSRPGACGRRCRPPFTARGTCSTPRRQRRRADRRRLRARNMHGRRRRWRCSSTIMPVPAIQGSVLICRRQRQKFALGQRRTGRLIPGASSWRITVQLAVTNRNTTRRHHAPRFRMAVQKHGRRNARCWRRRFSPVSGLKKTVVNASVSAPVFLYGHSESWNVMTF